MGNSYAAEGSLLVVEDSQRVVVDRLLAVVGTQQEGAVGRLVGVRSPAAGVAEVAGRLAAGVGGSCSLQVLKSYRTEDNKVEPVVTLVELQSQAHLPPNNLV